MILYVGRTALNTHITLLEPNWALNQPKDTDIIASYDDGLQWLKNQGCHTIKLSDDKRKFHGVRYGKIVDKKAYNPYHFEVEIATPGSLADSLLTMVWPLSVPDSSDSRARHAPLNALYMLKMSHRYRKNSPHFLKTMRDIQTMRVLGATIPDEWQEWYKARMKETYNYGHPKLNTSRANFFANDGINYVYDHDSIHEALKLMDRPAFDYFKPDTAEVLCSKHMFFEVDQQVRINAVYEESAVLAVERSIVPYPGALTHKDAFAKSLSKVASSVTSGWFREFAWENFDSVMRLHDDLDQAGAGYVGRFEAGLKNGVVKPFIQG